MIAISVNVNARQLTITMKLFCAIAVWPRPHSSPKTALPISMNLDRDFLTIAVNLDGDCLTICRPTCNCAYTIFHNDLDTTLPILCNSLSTLSMTFIAFSDINQVTIVYCDQFDVGMVYLSLWKLFLDLTGTLLQSIMTVTQRRGVLVKKECID